VQVFLLFPAGTCGIGVSTRAGTGTVGALGTTAELAVVPVASMNLTEVAPAAFSRAVQMAWM